MANLFIRNLRSMLILTVVWLAISALGKSAGGMLLLGSGWAILFGVVCWRIGTLFRKAIESKGDHPDSAGQHSLRLTGLMLGVLLAQIVLCALGLYYLEGGEMARKALFLFVGVAGSTSLLIPVSLWHPPAKWINSVVGLLLFIGLAIWWDVVRNLWPDELLLGPAIGLATFTLSALLIRLVLVHGYKPNDLAGPD